MHACPPACMIRTNQILNAMQTKGNSTCSLPCNTFLNSKFKQRVFEFLMLPICHRNSIKWLQAMVAARYIERFGERRFADHLKWWSNVFSVIFTHATPTTLVKHSSNWKHVHFEFKILFESILSWKFSEWSVVSASGTCIYGAAQVSNFCRFETTSNGFCSDC